MTIAEFEDKRSFLFCRECRVVGELALRQVGQHTGAICPRCGCTSPIDGVTWLSKRGAGDRVPRAKTGCTPAEVWEVNGNHCSFCGASRDLCARLHTGLTIQHVNPVCMDETGGEDGPLIPFCARCQEASVAALRRTRDIERALAELTEDPFDA